MNMPCANTLALSAYLRDLEDQIRTEDQQDELTQNVMTRLLRGHDTPCIRHETLVEEVCINAAMPKILIEATRNPAVAGQMLANLVNEQALILVNKHLPAIERLVRQEAEEERATLVQEERWYG